MKFVERARYVDPDLAARKLVERTGWAHFHRADQRVFTIAATAGSFDLGQGDLPLRELLRGDFGWRIT